MGTRAAQAVENDSTAFFMSNLLLSSPRILSSFPLLVH